MSYRILQHIMIFINLYQALGGCKYEMENYLRTEAVKQQLGRKKYYTLEHRKSQ